MDVYAVVSGYYSDWCLHGYCETLEEACNYCAYMNEQSDYDEYYPKKMSLLDKKTPTLKHYYSYRITFYLYNGTWNMRDFEEDEFEIVDKFRPSTIQDGRAIYKDVNWIAVTVCQDELNVDKAKRAAQDCLYTYLGCNVVF